MAKVSGTFSRIATFLVALSSSTSLASAEDEWIASEHSESKYFFNSSFINFEDTKAYCKSLNSSLPQFSSKLEQDWVHETVSKSKTFWASASVDSANEYEGWLDGSPFNYRDWAPGHPSSNSNSSVCYALTIKVGHSINRQANWYSQPCSRRLFAVCQRRLRNYRTNYQNWAYTLELVLIGTVAILMFGICFRFRQCLLPGTKAKVARKCEVSVAKPIVTDV